MPRPLPYTYQPDMVAVLPLAELDFPHQDAE
jgi:hypothetical protein